MLIRCDCGLLATWESYSCEHKCDKCVPRDNGDRRFRKPGQPWFAWTQYAYGISDDQDWVQHYPSSKFGD